MTKYDMDEKLSPPRTGLHPRKDHMPSHMDDKLWHMDDMDDMSHGWHVT